MPKFSYSIDIAAPPERVGEVICDPARWNEWTPSITSVTYLDGGFAVGRRATVRQPKLPPALWKVTVLEPRGFTWVSSAPGVRVIANHWAEPLANGSRATLSLEYSGLFGGLIARLYHGITERYLAMEANGLKARSENPAYRRDS
jgi:hypothetical protein